MQFGGKSWEILTEIHLFSSILQYVKSGCFQRIDQKWWGFIVKICAI